ncbi:MAG: 3D domain-containing protein [Caulobacteraceae bacterium]
MIAGLAAALALSASATPAAKPAAPLLPAADPIGELIFKARKAADEAVTAVETELKATLYHTGVRGVGLRDSLGCSLKPMRTVAVDPKVFPRHSILFIKETVGLKMPDGSAHDGYWYASDVGGAIKGARIDLFTGAGAASMKVLQALNLTSITAVKVGVFEGCPKTSSPTMVAQNSTTAER